jgi:tetratricopeptide (TPR) repeat protein
MKKFLLLIMLLSAGIMVYSQPVKAKLMPVTTNSRSALSLYSQAMKYFDDVNVNKALETFKKALDQDPDFFMVNYQLAFYSLLNQAPDDFNDFSDAAINCKARLSDAEELLKSALVRLKQDRTGITDVGEKLVAMYPEDPNSYNNMIYYQSLAGDTKGMVETIKKAISIVRNPAPFYNQLGYAYISLKMADEAEAAVDKYIELDPDNPNVYDSKGDYYMYIREYFKAYSSYMKANSLDRSFSRDKAEAARRLYEQTEGRKMDIITI